MPNLPLLDNPEIEWLLLEREALIHVSFEALAEYYRAVALDRKAREIRLRLDTVETLEAEYKRFHTRLVERSRQIEENLKETLRKKEEEDLGSGSMGVN